MRDTTGALAYLIGRSLVNRLARQAARIKQPRYALAVIIGLGYFWLVFAGPAARSRGPTPAGIGGTFSAIATIGLMLFVLGWWLFGGVNGALAFQPAEVQFLFPAPVSRRGLLAYKILRNQLPLLLSCVIWALLSSRWGASASFPLRLVTAWGVFSVLGLQRLGIALVRTPPVTGVRWGVRAAGGAVALAAVLAVLVPVGLVLRQFGQLGAAQTFKNAAAALTAPPASYALAPFHLVVAPLFAASTTAWLLAFVPVLGIIALHVAWVLSMGVKFEETAAVASEALARRIAAFRARRAGGAAVIKPGKVTRGWLPLSPTGPPAVAIAWKNTIALVRTGLVRTTIIIVALLVVGARVIARAEGGHGNAGLAAPFAVVALMALVIGPRMLRNDLRQDMLALPSLKTYPLTGAALVLAEMASPTILLTLFEVMLLGVGYLMIPTSARPPLSGPVLALAVVAPMLLLAMNGTTIAIQNGMALLFPGWVRLGLETAGVEMLGQSILVMIGYMLTLVVALLPPGIAGFAVFALGGAGHGAAGLVAALATGTVILLVELVAVVGVLGREFQKAEPAAS